MSQLMPYMTDEEIVCELWEYDEQGFDDLPQWLRLELRVRGLDFGKHEPTPEEMHDTIADAKDHRIYNNERNIQDFKDKYINKGMSNV